MSTHDPREVACLALQAGDCRLDLLHSWLTVADHGIELRPREHRAIAAALLRPGETVRWSDVVWLQKDPRLALEQLRARFGEEIFDRAFEVTDPGFSLLADPDAARAPETMLRHAGLGVDLLRLAISPGRGEFTVTPSQLRTLAVLAYARGPVPVEQLDEICCAPGVAPRPNAGVQRVEDARGGLRTAGFAGEIASHGDLVALVPDPESDTEELLAAFVLRVEDFRIDLLRREVTGPDDEAAFAGLPWRWTRTQSGHRLEIGSLHTEIATREIEAGPVVIDLEHRTVSAGDRLLRPHPQLVFPATAVLVRNPGRLVTYETLAEVSRVAPRRGAGIVHSVGLVLANLGYPSAVRDETGFGCWVELPG